MAYTEIDQDTLEQEVLTALDVSRFALYRAAPFFGAALARVDTLFTRSVETAAIDGVRIFINPEFWLKMKPDERMGILAHEVGHMLFGHLWRRGRREIRLSNIAMDYVLNEILLDECNFVLPDWVLYDKKYANKAWEEVYDELLQEEKKQQGGKNGPPQPGQGQGNGSGLPNAPDKDNRAERNGQKQLDSHEQWSEPGTEEGNKQEQQWRGVTAAAYVTAKRQGKLPAGIERLVDKSLRPPVDWFSLLYRFIREAETSDESWIPPDRRWVAEDIFFPAEKRDDTLRDMYACFDTSGSISMDELHMYCGSVEMILKNFQNTKGVLLVGDAAVHYEGDIQRTNLKKFPGGGGTDFRPFFERIDKKKRPVSVVIFFTDGYGSYPEKEPKYPVIWVITSGYDRVPWGTVVHVNR